MTTNLFRGLKFPFQKGTGSLPRQATDNELIRDDLIQLILTSRGERVMRPELGSDAFSYVFETNNDLLSTLIRNTVSSTVGKNEPRVVVRKVNVSRRDHDEQDSSVIITMHYVIPATQTAESTALVVGTQQGPAPTP